MRSAADGKFGRTSALWFVPAVTTDAMRTRKGDPAWNYEINCAQLCGLGHYRMRGFVTVDTVEEFQSWIDGEEQKLKEGGGEEEIWQ